MVLLGDESLNLCTIFVLQVTLQLVMLRFLMLRVYMIEKEEIYQEQ